MQDRFFWIDEWPAREAVRVYARLSDDTPAERAHMRAEGFVWDCGTLYRVCPRAEAAGLLRSLLERDYRLVPYLDRRVELQLLQDLGLTGGELTFHRRVETTAGMITWTAIYAFE
jgi:hypothetical protein